VTGSPAAPIAAGALVGAAAGFLLWVLGVSWAVAAAMALFGIAAGIAWAGFAGGVTPLFARLPADPRPGTRSDMTQIAWSLRGRHGEISDAGVKRLRAFARRRLAHDRLDLDDRGDEPRIRALLGDAAAAALIHGAVRTIADVERCLDALEAIHAAVVPARTTVHRRG
jgi:hypothetical protein